MEDKISHFVTKSLEGDHEAYAALVDAYMGMVFAVALNITGNYTESEDVVQETFLCAFEKLKTLSDPSKFASWLYAIARHTAFNLLRKNRRIPIQDVEDLLMERIPHEGETPAEAYARKELENLLWEEVANLPQKTREAVFLFYVEDFTITRIADFLGVSEGAVKSRLKFGRDKLRENLAQKLGFELGQHKPSKKTREAILMALPGIMRAIPRFPDKGQTLSPGKEPVSVPSPVPGSSPLTPSSFLLSASAKKILVIGFLVLAALICSLFISKKFRSPSPIESGPISLSQNEFKKILEKERAMYGEEETPIQVKQDDASSSRTFSVRGKVEVSSSNAPVPGMKIYLKSNSQGNKNTVSNNQGAFEFESLPQAMYEISFEPQEPLYFDKYLLPDLESIKLTLLTRDIEDILITVPNATYISGIVINQDDEPVPGASVFFLGTNDNQNEFYPYPVITTDSRGRFKFTGLGAREIPSYKNMIGCDAPGYGKVFLPNIPIPTYEKPVEDLVIRVVKGEGATVSGRVTNQEGRPFESVPVWAKNRSPLIYKKAVCSDAEGRFIFRNIPPGVITISDALRRGRSLDINIRENDKIENVELILDLPVLDGYISGILQDENGKPLEGVHLYSEPVQTQRPDNGTLTRDLGQFKILYLKNGSYVDLKVVKPEEWSWKETDAKNICVSTENLIVKTSLVSKPPFVVTVRGRVVDEGTHQPMEYFQIQEVNTQYYMETGPLSYMPKGKPTIFYSSNGSFEMSFESYARETHGLCAIVTGYVHNCQTFYIVDGKKEYQIEFLMRGQMSEQENPPKEEEQKQAIVTIEGMVLNGENQPVPGAEVSSTGGSGTAQTDTQGYFSLTFTWTNNVYFVLKVRHPEYAEYRSEALNTKNQQENILIKDYIVSLNRGGTIAGIVTDRKGNIQPNVSVKIGQDVWYGFKSAAVTNDEGWYEANMIPPGKYQVSIREPFEESRTSGVREGEITEVNFGFIGSSLSGKILVNNRPLSFARLAIENFPELLRDAGTAQNIPYVLNLSTTTDQNGDYLFEGIPEGMHYLKIFDGIRPFVSIALEIPENQEIKRDFNIQAGNIRGKATFSDGKTPVRSGFEIALYDKALMALVSQGLSHYSIASQRIYADPEGRFEFKKVPVGDYLIEADSQTYGKAFAEVSLKSEAPLPDVLLIFRDMGKIRIEAIDSATAEELHLWGNVMFEESQNRVASRFSQDPTPFTFSEINVGTYNIFAGLNDGKYNDNPPHNYYLSERETGVIIQKDKEAKIVLRMIKAVGVKIEVTDSQGKPVKGFESDIIDSRGSWRHSIEIRENIINATLVPGAFRLILTKQGKPFYDDTINVTPTPNQFYTEMNIILK